MSRPFFRWAGGKTRLLPELVRRVPCEIGTYAEPFVGGAALFFMLRTGVQIGHFRIRRWLLSDCNPELVATYRAVQRDPEGVHDVLAAYVASRELYATVRDQQPRSELARAARFLFLMGAGFNGLWRENRQGRPNAPMGSGYRVPTLARLHEASAALQGVEIRVADWRGVLRGLRPGDFAYLDPPYLTEGFSAYSGEGFGYTDHADLAAAATDLRARGVGFLLSNADTPEARGLYAGLDLAPIQVRRSIAAAGSARGAAAELLVS